MNSDTPELSWTVSTIENLDASTFHDFAKLRVAVFVVEQDCAYPEFDGLDCLCDTWHVIGKNQRDTVAYARILAPAPHMGDARVHIGRVVVAPEFRGRGVAQALFEKALQQARTAWPDTGVALSAQVQVTRFYERFGFEVISEMYHEDGIAHIDMVLNHTR